MEHFNRYVSSRGLLKSCTAYNIRPNSSSSFIDASIIDRLTPYGSIYICTDALLNFCQYILPNILYPFTLVTGDSDTSINSEVIENKYLTYLIDHPFLLNWFAQNLQLNHPKIHHLPIGNDYHTMYEKPGLWDLNQYTAIAQENRLIQIFNSSINFDDRFNMAYCNWHFAINRGDRQICFNEVDKNICYFEDHPLPRFASWERQSKFKFVISPEGAGLDCHRTWESLLLGCIPIVKTSTLDNLFKNLPVMIVKNWNEVTLDNLNLYLNSLPNRNFNFDSLYLSNWVTKIRGASPLSNLVLPCNQYKEIIK